MSRITCFSLAMLCALLPATLACANDGMLDTTFGFGGSGLATVPFDAGGNNIDDAVAVVVQADGKIVVAGSIQFETGSGVVQGIGVARLLSNGQGLDTTFASGGRRMLASASGGRNATSILLQPDGKILIGGWYHPSGQEQDMLFYRLTADGFLDTGFGVLGQVIIPFNATKHDLISAIALQSNGKIVGAGWNQVNGSDYDFAVVRLNDDGSLDTTFGFAGSGKNGFAFDAGGGNTDLARALTIDLYGNILLAGSATGASSGYDFAAVRFNSNGMVDSSFGSGGGVHLPIAGSDDDGAYGVALSYNGLLPLYTLAGYRHYSGNDYDFSAIQLDKDGNITPGFGVRSYPIDLHGTGMDIGRTIVAEFNGLQENFPRFTIGGYAYNNNTSSVDFAAIRLLADGQLDMQFGVGGKTSVAFDADASPPSTHHDYGRAIALQAHRAIFVGTIGRSFSSGNDTDFGIARLTADYIFANSFER